jgi:hypothetical protein
MIYSLRAEFQLDLDEFLSMAPVHAVRERYHKWPTFPDVVMEFESPAPLGTLKALCDLVKEGHVMRETLRPCPLSENDLKRTAE